MYAEGTMAFNTGDLETLETNDLTRTRPNPENVFQRVLSFSVNNSRDMLLNARGGMLGSKMISHNIYHKKVTNVSFNYFNEFENYPRIDENPIYNNNRIDQEDNTIGSFPDARIFVHSTSSQGTLQDRQYDDSNGNYPYATTRVPITIQERTLNFLNSTMELIYQ